MIHGGSMLLPRSRMSALEEQRNMLSFRLWMIHRGTMFVSEVPGFPVEFVRLL